MKPRLRLDYIVYHYLHDIGPESDAHIWPNARNAEWFEEDRFEDYGLARAFIALRRKQNPDMHYLLMICEPGDAARLPRIILLAGGKERA